MQCVLDDGVLVSPFIHPLEKKVLQWGASHGASIIFLTSETLGERYKPSGKFMRLCAEGRLLVVSVPDTKQGMRRQCLRMNELAVKIALGGWKVLGGK